VPMSTLSRLGAAAGSGTIVSLQADSELERAAVRGRVFDVLAEQP
jgi:hypothetical protein